MRKSVVLLVLLIASLSLSACVQGYPSFKSPRATLDTFFASAQKTDYSTTYDCYNQQYRTAVPESDFVSRRSKAALLKGYHIDSLSVSGDSASAGVSLTFAPGKGSSGSSPGVTKVREDLVYESGSWKIKVW